MSKQRKSSYLHTPLNRSVSAVRRLGGRDTMSADAVLSPAELPREALKANPDPVDHQ